jgi:hypothetical protein
MALGSNFIGVLWVMPGNILELLKCWKTLGNILELLQCWKTQGQRQSKRIYGKSSLLYLCGAYGERNRCLFEDCESNVVKLKASLFSSRLD